MITPEKFITCLAKRINCTEAEAKTVFNHCIDELKQVLLKGEEFTIAGFGKFAVKKTTARIGRNPKTGQPLPISAKHVPTFKPGDALKMYVRNALKED